jgi:hypothetical protein
VPTTEKEDSRLIALHFAERNPGGAIHHSDLSRLKWKSHQVCFFTDDAKETPNHSFSIRELATLFGLNSTTVRKM